jgi:hypothetical protein
MLHYPSLLDVDDLVLHIAPILLVKHSAIIPQSIDTIKIVPWMLFCRKISRVVDRYEISISQMTMDLYFFT